MVLVFNTERLLYLNLFQCFVFSQWQVWSLATSPKIKIFLWKFLNGSLSEAERLNSRGMKIDNHVFFDCTFPRQVWALSHVPSPENGFDKDSEFTNFNYLLNLEKNPNCPKDVSNIYPWILWRLWKNRNSFFFEGKIFNAFETVEKIKENAEKWFNAQKIDLREEIISESQGTVLNRKWCPPPNSWLKCNVGVTWSKRTKVCGAGWILRDSEGLVLIHSRRTFSNVKNLLDAKFLSPIWSMESMLSHRINKVIFALESRELVGSLNRPQAWPSFRFYASELKFSLERFKEWSLEVEYASTNRGAYLIAQSALSSVFGQSYVASNHPIWLNELFASERVVSSV